MEFVEKMQQRVEGASTINTAAKADMRLHVVGLSRRHCYTNQLQHRRVPW